MNKKSKKIIFILASITVLMIIFIAVSSSPSSPLYSVYKVIGTPFSYIQKGFSSFGTSIKNSFAVIGDYSEIKDEISSLKEENETLSRVQKVLAHYAEARRRKSPLRGLNDLNDPKHHKKKRK